MNSRRIFPAVIVLSFLVPQLAIQAADVTGKWKNTITNQNGETREYTFNLKQDGTTVTGNVLTPQGNEVEIQDGKIDAKGNLSFASKVEQNGRTIEFRSTASLEGDSLKGKTEFPNRDGEKQERQWIAKRESKSKNVTGKWNSSFTIQAGSKLESELRLKQDGEKLTGSQSFNGNETEIKDGKIAGDEVSFKILRDRDGRTVTAKYQGKVQSNGEIKGHIDSDWTGDVRRLDWEAKKAE